MRSNGALGGGDGLAWLWRSRWTHWWLKAPSSEAGDESCMIPSFAAPLADDEIERGVEAFRRARINAVLTEGLRGLIRYELEGETGRTLAAVARAARACRRVGIRMAHHTTTTFASQTLAEIPIERREWLSLDARTGAPAFVEWREDWPGDGWFLWCVNNPEFRREYFRLARQVIRETGVDGLMVDEVYFRSGWHNCACPHCRAKFRQLTGWSLPDGGDPGFWGRFDQPEFRSWIRFRAASVGDFYQELAAALQIEHPAPVVFGCRNQAECPAGVPLFGDGNEERMRGVNLLFTELCHVDTSILRSWRRLSVCLMAYNGLNGYYGPPTLAIIYCPPPELFLNWAIRSTHGVRVWATSGGGALSRRSQLLSAPRDLAAYGAWFAWEEEFEAELTGALRPWADIGVLLSAATRDMAPTHQEPPGAAWYRSIREWAGWCETLTEESIQYAVVVEPELIASPAPPQPALLILPDVCCLSNDACRAIVAHVATGGGLIFTHETGCCDETGAAMPGRLAELTGGTLAAGVEPLVRFGQHGRGRWVYFANLPGRDVFTDFIRVDAAWTWGGVGDPPVAEAERRFAKTLMLAAVDWAAPVRRPVRITTAPTGLLVKAWLTQTGDAALVHLLNLRGEAAVPSGGIIHGDYTVEFPPLAHDLEVELDLAPSVTATMFSPDWRGVRTVPAAPDGHGVRLTIPAAWIERYAVLRVVTTRRDEPGRC